MAKNTNRDDFTPATKRKIERQARGHCSNPMCRRLTSGATSDGANEINIGEAAHICAAAPRGPRYDLNMTAEERRSASNGIWLCDIHARAVDSRDSVFTVDELREWKRRTDEDSWRSINENVPYGPGMHAPTPDELRDRLRTAAATDLAVFKRTAKWPPTTVALTLKVNHTDDQLSTHALARAVTTLDDLILVAPPGMGKTSTVFQVAEGVLELATGTPLIVLLGDWATENETLLDSVLQRPAFMGVSETEFRTVAANPGVVLLLDGWNELDAAARERARVQLADLKARLPELGLVISTRKEAFDVPLSGTRVDLLALNDEQQMEIAQALRGEFGARLVDQAWRTPGVRELVTIPLYLTALLSLPDGEPFPTTKEEVLRRFVAVHEQDARRAAALNAATHGFQQSYLDGLAVFATKTANTAITDSNARRSIAGTSHDLVTDGQLTIVTTQPGTLLDTLVSNHVLMRAGDTPGYSFQHQQFQEWYASHEVERLMIQAGNDTAAHSTLKADVLNQRPWTEAILFAVERMARGNAAQKAACSAAILAAFEVDPMLAGDMIFRATDDVWTRVSTAIHTMVDDWHVPGKLDRAVRFMVTSGRPEFSDLLWPLLTHENDQIHLAALRAARRFRPTVFGSDAAERIAALPPEVRKNVLHEIASQSGIDGLDLATQIAKADPDPEVKAMVVDALAFRRADRHVVELLTEADDATYDILAEKGHIDDIATGAVQEWLRVARERRKAAGVSHREHLRALLYDGRGEGAGAEIADIIAAMEIDRKRDGERHLLYEVQKRYPQALADGLLRRVRENRSLFYGADDILAAAGFSLEDEALVTIVLGEPTRHNDHAEAAASVLGPQAVGKLVDEYLAARKVVRDASGKYDKAEGDRYHGLFIRIGHTPGASLVAAVQQRAATTDAEEIAELAGLFSRETHGDRERARPFNQVGLAAIGALAQDWGERLLSSGNTSRWHTAAIATLISHAPSTVLLPILKRLLDDNLHRYRTFKEAAKASGGRDRDAVHEARHPHMHEYQRAFMATKAPETTALMGEYLADMHFGELAARVLAVQWIEANEPQDDRKFRFGEDFTRVEARREARTSNPGKSCAEADMIFGVIDRLSGDDASDDQKKLAVALGIVGARLPHGQRSATIDKLITLAPRKARPSLLLALVQSGEEIDINLVADGIAETLKAAEAEPWILTQSEAYEIRVWLRLLPFATPVSRLPAVVGSLPEPLRKLRILAEMIEGLVHSPSEDAETVLFALADNDARFYTEHNWRATALRLATASVARRLVDLTVAGALNSKSTDDWHWRRELGGLISEFPDVRAHVRELLNDGPTTNGLALLAHAIAESPGTDELLMLIDFEIANGRSFLSWQSIQNAVTEHVPSEDWEGAYSVVPIPAIELRQHLLVRTTNGGANDAAARCLNLIDEFRDNYGAPEDEPRHPDLASGKRWPIMKPDSDARDGN